LDVFIVYKIGYIVSIYIGDCSLPEREGGGRVFLFTHILYIR